MARVKLKRSRVGDEGPDEARATRRDSEVTPVIRGIRGATTVDRNQREDILSATEELLQRMAELNGVSPEEMTSIIFTMTPDLNAAFPAEAARRLGWKYVPLMCMSELAVPGSLPRTIRVLMQAETARLQSEVRHVYLREARVLRSDLEPVDAAGGSEHER